MPNAAPPAVLRNSACGAAGTCGSGGLLCGTGAEVAMVLLSYVLFIDIENG
jgi:hypothetical protein